MSFEVKEGSFSYKNSSRPVLDGVSFRAEEGDLAAILGPNGAGKTTLLRCAMGFLRWSGGGSFLDEKDITSLSYGELWRSIAYVPQASGAAAPYTAFETVLLGRSSRFGFFSQPGAADIGIAEGVMERLGISKLRDKPCSEISGGEKQMVLIARALAAEPRVLILDEPESNLDFRNQLLIMETLSSLAASGMTCIFNTHYPAHAMRRANKALLLGADGKSLFGEVGEVVTEANIERAFGVKAVISEVETPVNITRDVIPVMVTENGGGLSREAARGERKLAVVSVISSRPEAGVKINSLLHQYNRYIVGRMGMPYPECGVDIININFDAPEDVTASLTQSLGILPGVSVKATYAGIEGRKGDG